MKYQVRDILEYIIAIVNDFAKKFGLREKEAYHYIQSHNGIEFLEQNYGIIHTLDFDEAMESVISYCRKFGGTL